VKIGKQKTKAGSGWQETCFLDLIGMVSVIFL